MFETATTDCLIVSLTLSRIVSKSILSISFMTRVAVSEKLSMSDGAGGMSRCSGFHETGCGGGVRSDG